MGSFAVNIEVPAERDRIIEMFSEMDFSTALCDASGQNLAHGGIIEVVMGESLEVGEEGIAPG